MRGVVQGEKDERHIRESKGGEAEMEENAERRVKCEKSAERRLEKRVGRLGACSHGTNLEVFLL